LSTTAAQSAMSAAARQAAKKARMSFSCCNKYGHTAGGIKRPIPPPEGGG
jgi:hypothetical protein